MTFNDESLSSLYIPVKELVDTYTASAGIEISENAIGIKIAEEAHGLVVTENGVAIELATTEKDGALSKKDKKTIEALDTIYAAKKYNISDLPVNSTVDYDEKEIRILCPKESEWTHQSVGANGDLNKYYVTLKAYAPKNAVYFKEGLGGPVEDKLFSFTDEAAGTDEFGRNYSVCWLPVAGYEPETDSWTYFGTESSAEKLIGWDYTVEWYNARGEIIENDTIRINLSNESCHSNILPYYMTNYALKANTYTRDEVEALIADACSWTIV
jgi:hypothetical protein